MKSARRRLKSIELELARIAAPATNGHANGHKRAPALPGRGDVVRHHADSGRTQLVDWNLEEEAAADLISKLIKSDGTTLTTGGYSEGGWVYFFRESGHSTAWRGTALRGNALRGTAGLGIATQGVAGRSEPNQGTGRPGEQLGPAVITPPVHRNGAARPAGRGR